MIIRKYNVTLRRLEEKDIELVRVKRNSPAIKTRMFYQEEITTESQEEWFRKLDRTKHFYFIIEVKGKEVGLLNGNLVSLASRTINAGIFIWDEKFLATRTAIASALCALDFYFYLLKMNEVKIEVRTDNERAIAFNEYLGFVAELQENDMNKVWLQLTTKKYTEHTKKIRRGVMRAAKETKPLSWEDISLSNEDKLLLNDVIHF